MWRWLQQLLRPFGSSRALRSHGQIAAPAAPFACGNVGISVLQ